MVQEWKKDVISVGTVVKNGEVRKIVLEKSYGAGLKELNGFGHIMVLWWADRYETHRFEAEMVMDLPYASGLRAGLFASRSPVRPNPIGVNIAKILSVDLDTAEITVDEIDAFDGTKVLDIKPYYGCIDRVEDYRQPDWVPEDWGTWYVPIPEMDYE